MEQLLANLTLYWQQILSAQDSIINACKETLIMVSIATIVAIVFGTIIGITLNLTSPKQLWENKWINKPLATVVDFLRAFPFIILMVVVAPLSVILIDTRIGAEAAAIALSVAAIPYFARLVEQNLREIPKGIIEAAQAMGASNTTIILKVLLTEARAGLLSSTTILIISILSYSAAAGMIGGGGLGDLAVRDGYGRNLTGIMIVVVIILSIIVILIQTLGNYLTRKLDKR